MKKIIKFFVILVILGFGGYYVYINYFANRIPRIDVEEEKVIVDEYYLYGNHFNLKGNLKIDNLDYEDIYLILYNGEEKKYDINVDKKDGSIDISTSNYINDGMFIDNLERGKYYLFLKLSYTNEEDKEKPISKYYVLSNDTKYDDIVYYTLSKYNNKILINADNDYETFMFSVSENHDEDKYDVTIDPGHGGMDSGAISGSYKESDLSMDISLKLKKYLEDNDFKVKLTHDKNDISSDKTMDEYNEHGRAVIPNEVKSKYTFSIHLNKNESSSVKGIEVYTPNSINYEFAKNIVNNIVESTDFGYSTNRMYKVYDGIYTHNFTEKEIASSLSGYEKKGYNPYKISTNSNYLYMIRETGGYLTGAYVDDSNPVEVGVNPYYHCNWGNESYLLELGYLSNTNDLSIILKSEDLLAETIGKAIVNELSIES